MRHLALKIDPCLLFRRHDNEGFAWHVLHINRENLTVKYFNS
jgi:hypothetical protein